MESDKKRFARQIAIFGKEGQGRIQNTKVALVGFGGLGTFVLPEICLLGIKDVAIIENESFSRTNRNRYMGFVHTDINHETGIGVDKVLVAERIAKSIDPAINIKLVKEKLESQIAFDAIQGVDIVFGCLDCDGARSVLNELCIAYGKIYIDLASEVFTDGTFGGRVAVVMNGDGCLNCMADGLDQDEVRRYFESEQQLGNEAAIYGVDKESLAPGSGPSVVDLNGIIGSLGVQEFKSLVTGREPCRYLNYRGHLRALSKVEIPYKKNCYSCSLFNLYEDKQKYDQFST